MASIYDVRTEGGRRVTSKADIVSNRDKGGCVNLRTRGKWVKKSEKFADIMYGSPQTAKSLKIRGCVRLQIAKKRGWKKKENANLSEPKFRAAHARILMLLAKFGILSVDIRS